MKICSPIHRAWRQFKLHLEELLISKGISADEAHAIGYIAGYGPVSMGNIGRVLGLKPSTLTSMMDRLEKQGYISRKHDKENRRLVLVSVESKGLSLAQEGWVSLDEIETRIKSRVNQRDLEGFEAVLSALDKELNINVRQEKLK